MLRQPGQTTPPDLLLQPHAHTHARTPHAHTQCIRLPTVYFSELLSINATVAARPDDVPSRTFDQTKLTELHEFKVKGDSRLERWEDWAGGVIAMLRTYTRVCNDL